MRSKINIFFFFLTIWPNFLIAQKYSSKNYTTNDGLANNAIRSLFLDTNSDLWIGTENGISKFENGNFTTLNFNKEIQNISCWDITQDYKGNMWFASYGNGICKYDGKKYTSFTSKDGLPTNRIRKIIAYKNLIIAGTELGIVIINCQTNKVTVPKGIQPHFGVFIITDFLIYQDQIYFSALNEGMYKIDFLNNIPEIKLLFSHKTTYSLKLLNDTVYSSNKGFISKYAIKDLINGKPIIKSFGNSIVWDYAKVDTTLFASAWGIYDSSGGLYSVKNDYLKNDSDNYGIDSKQLLNVIYNKKNKTIYVGSKDKGIYEIRVKSDIQNFSFESKSIIDFDEIENKKMILHQNGISILDINNSILKSVTSGDFKKFELNFLKTTTKILPKHEDGYFELNYNLKENEIEYYEIVKHNKSIWITSNIGVFELNFLGQIINYVPIHSYKIAFSTDDEFIETIPYAGDRVYENVYNLKSKHFSEFDKNTPKDILKTLNINDKTYLISLFDGLFVYQKNTFKSYLNNGIWKEKKLKFITKNSKGNLIIASEAGSVYVINDNKKFSILETISKEIIIGNTFTFLESYKEYLIIGTEKGITIYRNGLVQFIDKEQGFFDNIVTTSQLFNDELWLGTKKGFYKLNLTKLLSNQPTVSKIEIRNITINTIPLNKSNYKWFNYNSNKLILNHKENTIMLDFIPKGHLFPNKLKFRYRIKNTNQWSPYLDKQKIYLSYLPSDKYFLEIEVTDLNSGKTTIFKTLSIVIKPPFWATWWFITVILLLAITILLFTIYKIKKNVENKEATRKIIAQSKLEALLSQMNPHFTFNALNAIQNFIFNNDAHNSVLYMSNFAQLIRQTLENSTKQMHSLEDEIDFIEKYIKIENLRFDNKISYKIIVDKMIDKEFTEIPPMLLQPFVENIFNHAFTEKNIDPKFFITFKLKDKILNIEIKDNGNGKTTKQNSHISKGITITQQRIQLLQPENKIPVEINYTENGTTVTINYFI